MFREKLINHEREEILDEMLVLAVIYAYGSTTSGIIATRLKLSETKVWFILRSLEKKGKIVKSSTSVGLFGSEYERNKFYVGG